LVFPKLPDRRIPDPHRHATLPASLREGLEQDLTLHLPLRSMVGTPSPGREPEAIVLKHCVVEHHSVDPNSSRGLEPRKGLPQRVLEDSTQAATELGEVNRLACAEMLQRQPRLPLELGKVERRALDYRR
jgi:hypothetical protein